jgi:peroxiredoxin
LKTLQSILPHINAAGGKAIAVTAEPEQHLQDTINTSGYTGEIIVDPTNKIAAEMRQRVNLTVAISSKSGYEHGMAQPAILVIQNDGTVLFKWAIVPGVMNLGGAKDRPDLNQVWENVLARLNGQPLVHERYGLQSFMKVMTQKFWG